MLIAFSSKWMLENYDENFCLGIVWNSNFQTSAQVQRLFQELISNLIKLIITAWSPSQEYFRGCMLYDFLSDRNIGRNIISLVEFQRTVRDSFERFKAQKIWTPKTAFETWLKCDQSTIVRPLAFSKLTKLTERDRDRMTLSTFQWGRIEWLDSFITGDGKWILYVNVARRHQGLVKESHYPVLATTERRAP